MINIKLNVPLHPSIIERLDLLIESVARGGLFRKSANPDPFTDPREQKRRRASPYQTED